MTTPQTIDVREFAPKDRHPMIFEAFDRLGMGESLDLVNDHDPKPLFYQFIHERDGAFRWQYIDRGPELWRVRLAKAPPGTAGAPEEPAGCTCGNEQGEVPEEFKAQAGLGGLVLDTRPVFAAKQDPFSAIIEGAGRLKQGEALTVLVPFEPLPLYAVMKMRGYGHETAQVDGMCQVVFKRTT